jgi:UDP:flavonoid glycosyltransferase YjiC (YdhE family)/LPS sulfotransferase NodH
MMAAIGEPANIAQQPATRTCLIATTSGAGGGLLASRLAAAGIGRGRGDHLNALAVPGYARAWDLQAIGDSFPERYLRAVCEAATDANGTCVLNLSWPAHAWTTRIARAALGNSTAERPTDPELLAEFFANPRWVLLGRRDIAEQARAWHRQLSRDNEPFGEGRVERIEDVLRRHHRAWELYLATHRVDYLPLDFEDLRDDPEATLASVATWLGPQPVQEPRVAGSDQAGRRDQADGDDRATSSASRVPAPGLRPGGRDWRPHTLFSVRPFRGHLHPMIPLARACRRDGHAIAVASADDVAQIVTGAGLPWIPAGMNPREVESVYPESDSDYGVESVGHKLADLLDLAAVEFRPDVIVRDPTDLAAALAAEILGVEHVIYGLGHFIPRESWRILGADTTLRQLRAEYGLPDEDELDCLYRGLYLEVLPRVFEKIVPIPVEHVQRLRYIAWDGGLPERAQHDPHKSRPKVLATLGTVYNTDTDLFLRFLAALDGQDLDVICTIGEDADAAALGTLPSNVRIERYLPHSEVLPDCDAMLCHAGLNTLLGGLVCGVPVVCVPLGSDQGYNAERCSENGLGLVVTEPEASAERIRAAVLRVLGEPQFKANVKTFQKRVERMPGPLLTAQRLRDLALARTPG